MRTTGGCQVGTSSAGSQRCLRSRMRPVERPSCCTSCCTDRRLAPLDGSCLCRPDLRYRVEGTDTGFSGEEGTFTICSFWLVSALAMTGQTDRARALCHKLLSFAGPLLLYAEEIDTATGEHLGNFPQAFTHLALIEAVSLLIASELAQDVKSAGRDPAASTQVRSG